MELSLQCKPARNGFVPYVLAVALVWIFAVPGRGQSQWQVKPSSTNSSLNAVAFGNGRLLAAGRLSSDAVLTSTDRIAFHPVAVARYPNSPGGPIQSVIYFGGQFYAATGYWGFYSSPDGAIWKAVGDWGSFFTIGVAMTDQVRRVAVLGSSNP